MPEEPELQLFEPMSPAAFRPLDGVPGCCAVARDEQFRLIWCNDEYARQLQTKPQMLRGQTIADIMPRQKAEERMAYMRPALEGGTMVAYQQFWVGHRWLTRVWPLDPDAFGRQGYFVVITKLAEPLGERDTTEGKPIRFIYSADLGDLEVLSPRELEVFYYLAAGMTVGDIAGAIHRSEKTIGRHVEHIHKKMGYSSRAELVRDAVQRGLIAYTDRQWLDLVDKRRGPESGQSPRKN